MNPPKPVPFDLGCATKETKQIGSVATTNLLSVFVSTGEGCASSTDRFKPYIEPSNCRGGISYRRPFPVFVLAFPYIFFPSSLPVLPAIIVGSQDWGCSDARDRGKGCELEQRAKVWFFGHARHPDGPGCQLAQQEPKTIQGRGDLLRWSRTRAHVDSPCWYTVRLRLQSKLQLRNERWDHGGCLTWQHVGHSTQQSCKPGSSK